MDFNEIDLRLRAMEKQLKNFEKYLRSDRFRTGRRIIFGILFLIAAAVGAFEARIYLRLSNDRITRVDTALGEKYPSYDSEYCHWIHGNLPGYDDCLRTEQKAFTRFEAAWGRSRKIDAMREQMISCFNAAQNEGGMSWKTAADCAELNDDLPEDKALPNPQ